MMLIIYYLGGAKLKFRKGPIIVAKTIRIDGVIPILQKVVSCRVAASPAEIVTELDGNFMGSIKGNSGLRRIYEQAQHDI